MGIKDIRLAKGVKLQSAATALNITRQTFSKLEANPELMTTEQIFALADFLACDPVVIFLACGDNLINEKQGGAVWNNRLGDQTKC